MNSDQLPPELTEEVLFALLHHDPHGDTYKVPAPKHAALVAFFISIVVLSVIIVVARLWTRWYVLKTFGADDWVIIPAEVCHMFHLFL